MSGWWLPEASANASELDWLLLALLGISLAVLALVFGLIWLYVIRYRASHALDRGKIGQKNWRFEVAWTAATLVLFFCLFVWGANLYVRQVRPPSDALKIYVVGKQWMWKVEHPGGQREINALHVPVDTDIQLLMTSEDVIHDFAIPAFRLKHDVLPGRFETLWFRPVATGDYHLFCTQFCGTDHSVMGGAVTVLSRPDYQRWLATSASSPTLAEQGRALFTQYGCAGCHYGGSSVRAPSLVGVFGGPVPLSDGTVVTADEKYIRDSILMPKLQIVAGYEPRMPSFAGVIPEDDLIRLIAFIKSLAARGAAS